MGSIDNSQPNGASHTPHYDAIVIGAGFGGCYSLYKLRKLGFSTHLFEAGSALGGVWHWNSYPGARVDSEMPYYQFSIPEVYKTWNWSRRFPGHEELKRYFAHVDSVLGLSKDISFNNVVIGADFDVSNVRWTVTTSTGNKATCKYLLPATGNSHRHYTPNFPDMAAYRGALLHSALWPKQKPSFAGKRVAIIGAGATGVQLVQEISKEAEHLTVYIRNPNLALPMMQRDISELENKIQKGIYRGLFEIARKTAAGLACDTQPLALTETSSQEEREEYWEELWQRGGFSFQAANYRDFLVDATTNRMIYDFWAAKVRTRIRDPAKQVILAPEEPPFPFATKRSSLEQDYYECLDRDNVELVPLKKTPIQRFSEKGLVTDNGTEREHDVIVLATGFDNMTGSLNNMGLRGKDGVDMKERWKDGVWTYLGLMVSGCPNMFMIFGPQGKRSSINWPGNALPILTFL